MALAIQRVRGFGGVLVLVRKRADVISRLAPVIGLFLVAACAQSPTTDAVPDPSTGSSEQADGDSGAGELGSGGNAPSNSGGTSGSSTGSSSTGSSSTGSSSTGSSGTKPVSTPGTTPRADAGVTRDASAATMTPSGGGTKDAAAPSGGNTTPIDASTGPTGGATTPDASMSGGTPKDAAVTTPVDTMHCAATPSYPTTNACAQCICSKCGSQVAQCYASGDAAKDMQCVKVQTCAESKKCASTSCYCGNALLCLAPSGPCVDEIQSAAGTTTPTEVQTASNDTMTSVGRANAIGTCSMSNCKSECGL